MTSYYSTINEVVLTFSNISRNKDGFASIVARFERPNATGFDFSEWQLPCIANTKAFGFSEDDIMMQERYLRNNMPLIWEMAREREGDAEKRLKRYLILCDMSFSFGRAKMLNRLMFMYAKALRQRCLQNFG